MAFGNERQGGGGKDTFVRLSGVFPTAKGNLIGRVGVEAFNTVYEMMQEAAKINGSLNIIIAKNKKTGKPEMYGVVGQPYEKKVAAPAGPFGQFSPAPPAASQPTQSAAPATFFAPAASREVQFGTADVPKDDFDKLLESL